MTDERRGAISGTLDLGFGIALGVSEMIQDEKLQFSRGIPGSSPAKRTRAREGQADYVATGRT